MHLVPIDVILHPDVGALDVVRGRQDGTAWAHTAVPEVVILDFDVVILVELEVVLGEQGPEYLAPCARWGLILDTQGDGRHRHCKGGYCLKLGSIFHVGLVVGRDFLISKGNRGDQVYYPAGQRRLGGGPSQLGLHKTRPIVEGRLQFEEEGFSWAGG